MSIYALIPLLPLMAALTLALLGRRLQGAEPDFRGELADVRSWWLFQP